MNNPVWGYSNISRHAAGVRHPEMMKMRVMTTRLRVNFAVAKPVLCSRFNGSTVEGLQMSEILALELKTEN